MRGKSNLIKDNLNLCMLVLNIFFLVVMFFVICFYSTLFLSKISNKGVDSIYGSLAISVRLDDNTAYAAGRAPGDQIVINKTRSDNIKNGQSIAYYVNDNGLVVKNIKSTALPIYVGSIISIERVGGVRVFHLKAENEAVAVREGDVIGLYASNSASKAKFIFNVSSKLSYTVAILLSGGLLAIFTALNMIFAGKQARIYAGEASPSGIRMAKVEISDPPIMNGKNADNVEFAREEIIYKNTSDTGSSTVKERTGFENASFNSKDGVFSKSSFSKNEDGFIKNMLNKKKANGDGVGGKMNSKFGKNNKIDVKKPGNIDGFENSTKTFSQTGKMDVFANAKKVKEKKNVNGFVGREYNESKYNAYEPETVEVDERDLEKQLFKERAQEKLDRVKREQFRNVLELKKKRLNKNYVDAQKFSNDKNVEIEKDTKNIEKTLNNKGIISKEKVDGENISHDTRFSNSRLSGIRGGVTGIRSIKKANTTNANNVNAAKEIHSGMSKEEYEKRRFAEIARRNAEMAEKEKADRYNERFKNVKVEAGKRGKKGKDEARRKYVEQIIKHENEEKLRRQMLLTAQEKRIQELKQLNNKPAGSVSSTRAGLPEQHSKAVSSASAVIAPNANNSQIGNAVGQAPGYQFYNDANYQQFGYKPIQTPPAAAHISPAAAHISPAAAHISPAAHTQNNAPENQRVQQAAKQPLSSIANHHGNFGFENMLKKAGIEEKQKIVKIERDNGRPGKKKSKK